ncbi:hypothetical protein CYY_002223 [Polysphondylium violaceum]|uniref:Alkaline phosphatase n=1 Tax=Polysphondylium violaceum TaxID=133409 RepID=A0A8J4V338_9MYCE|nr:hypothetical protein CYY_002223 [Polysphondylium violaceum]
MSSNNNNNTNNNNVSRTPDNIGEDEEDIQINSETGMSHFLLEEDFSPKETKILRKYKKIFYLLAAFLTIVTIVLLIVFLLPRGWTPPKKLNVIMMIGDGMGPAAMTLARVAFNRSLVLDHYLIGTVRTYSFNSTVTDSAAGATAYASCIKTNNTYVGVDPWDKPAATLMEAAKKNGLKTGLVVTTRVSDATPAAYFSHSHSRYEEKFIITQLPDKDVDVVLGGGKKYFTDAIINSMSSNGYSTVYNKTDMNKVKKGKILGLFADGDIPFEVDRLYDQTSENIETPSLKEMSQKAIELLNQDNSKGFFLMLEGSKIDVCGHANDASGQIYETQAFDDAFQVALDFAKKDGHTIILVTADHETGGLTLGLQDRIDFYNEYYWNNTLITKVERSSLSMANMIIASNFTKTREIIQQYAKVEIDDSDLALLESLNSTSKYRYLQRAVGYVISRHAEIGWTTGGHTGVDVNLYAYAPDSLSENTKKEKISPLQDLFGNNNNIDICNFIKSKLNLDLESITKTLMSFSPFPPAK